MKRRLATGVWVCGLLLPLPSHALLEVCTVTALPVAFGSYDPLGATPVDSTGQVTVTCTGVISLAVSYSIGLSQGGSGTYAPRRMSLLSNTLNYNLYTSSGYGTVWGDGSGGTATVSDSYSVGILLVTRNYTVYGRIPGSQNIAGGAYSDLITVTVNY